MTTPPAQPAPEHDNGIVAQRYQKLRSVDRRECEQLLRAMAEAGIACYTAVPPTDSAPTREVFVDADLHARAAEVADQAHRRYAGRRIAIDASEVDVRFAELISLFGDPVEPRDAGPSEVERTEPRASTAEVDTDVDRPVDPAPRSPEPRATEPWRAPADAQPELLDEDDEGHFEPPPPEPLPKPTRRVVVGILLMIAGCVALFAPGSVPLSGTASLVLGVLLLGAGVGWLVWQLREHPEDPFDDGSRV
ncbi:hypothetical protein [Cumulibacter manganitolerans]|uniref:hypothetical protein n=1 Tax=Cumulibacter manganitolerans TaxID=1884992 RepID=UPI001295DC98|nr:hypothetical protein [Cumulibacter manganitolerans]